MDTGYRYSGITVKCKSCNAGQTVNYYSYTVKLGYNEQLGTGHFCLL